MQRTWSTMRLDTGATAPFWASQIRCIWQIFAQLADDDFGVMWDVAVCNDDGSGWVQDMGFGIAPKCFGEAADAVQASARVDVFELAFAVAIILCGAHQADAEQITNECLGGRNAAAQLDIVKLGPSEEMAYVAAIFYDEILDVLNAVDCVALNCPGELHD